jgi:DNA-binding NarL/FixJ family response regulator
VRNNADKAEMHGEQLTILLVDDHELMRSGLRMLVESCLGHDVVEASSAEEALERVREQPPDVIFLDVRMPRRDGLWALERLREESPATPVLMLSTYDDGEYIHAALKQGAAGYVLKEASVKQVAEAIATAVEGRGVYLHPVAAQRLLDDRRTTLVAERLTERERDVLALLVDGATNEEIASRLFVTEKTVKTHLSSVFRKLGVANRTQAAMKALKEGFVRPASGRKS